MKWLAETISSHQSVTNGESDRGTVLVSSAKIEDLLERIIRNHLIPPKEKKDPLFDGISPLGTFGAKIEMAYRLGHISNKLYRDLNRLRKLRNKFAHSSKNCDFNESDTSASIDELVRTFPLARHHDLNMSPRQQFEFITSWMIWWLGVVAYETTRVNQAGDEFAYTASETPPDLEEVARTLMFDIRGEESKAPFRGHR